MSGSPLFLCFVNDPAHALKPSSCLVTNDVKMIMLEGWAGRGIDERVILDWACKNQLLSWNTESLTVPHGTGQLSVEAISKVKGLGIITTSDLKWTDQCAASFQKARDELIRLKSMLSCRKSVLYKSITRPHLVYCVQACSPLFTKDTSCLVQAQRITARMIEGHGEKSYD